MKQDFFTLRDVIAIGSSVISFLLIILYLLFKRFLIKFDEIIAEVKKLSSSAAVQNQSCKLTHEAVNARLNAHSGEIKEIKNKLELHLETSIK